MSAQLAFAAPVRPHAAIAARHSQFRRVPGQLCAAPTSSTRRPVRSVLTRAGDDKGGVDKDKVKVNFAIKMTGNYGDQVCVVGNTEKLGKWNAQNGVWLTWSDGDVWKGSVTVPQGGYVEYKLAVKDKKNKVHWETRHNRTLQLFDGGSDLTVTGRYGNGGSLHIAKKDATKNVKVAFAIHTKVTYGHEIAIVGGAKELGGWNPDDAIPLKWEKGDVWKAEVEMTAGGQVEYKMITRRIRTGQWKSEFRRDFKRIVQVYSGGETVVCTGEYRGMVDVRLKLVLKCVSRVFEMRFRGV